MIYVAIFSDQKFSSVAETLGAEISNCLPTVQIFHWTPDLLSRFPESPLLDLDHHERGYGFWSWKPFVLRCTMEMAGEGDQIFYLDAGCKFNPKGKKRFLEYVTIVKEFGSIVFESGLETSGIKNIGAVALWTEDSWTKLETLIAMGSMNSSVDRPQRIATAFGLRNDDTNRKFIHEWLDMCMKRELIDDSISIVQHEKFIENRHDQSIFSILSYKYGLKAISNREIELPSQHALSWKIKLLFQPIIAKRRRPK